VRVKRNDRYLYPALHSFALPHKRKWVHTRPPMMQQTESQGVYGRLMIRRAWHNTDGQQYRTTGPAVEHWTVLPGGAHLLTYQGWFLNDRAYREGRPAVRGWHIADDGTRVLVCEEWKQHGSGHRVGGPSYRHWTVKRDGTRRLAWEGWHLDGKLHRADGPAQTGPDEFWWHDRQVRQEDLPWLRRGRCFLVGLAGFTGATATLCSDGDGGGEGGSVSPAWSRDVRVAVTWHGGGPGDAVVPAYRSAVGGSVLLCV